MDPSSDRRARATTSRTVVVATNNRGKLRELRVLAADLPIELVLPADVGAGRIDVVEDGDTFVDNAAKKARAVAAVVGLPVLADDSGLEVDALDGRPGVHSARFAGEGATDAANNAKLVDELSSIGAGAGAAARFRCVLVFFDPAQGTWWRADGTCEGRVVASGRGQGGFGYDPLFVVEDLPGSRTMAELTTAEKSLVSHRARAFEALRPALLAWASGAAPHGGRSST